MVRGVRDLAAARGARHGGSAVIVILVLALALVCGLAWWVGRSTTPSAPVAQGPTPNDPPIALPDAPARTPAVVEDPGERVAVDPAPTRTGVSGKQAANDTFISIEVRDAGGKPFQGAWQLEIENTEIAARHADDARRVLDEEGPSVSVAVRPENVHVLCARSGELASATARCRVDTAHPSERIVLVLEPAARIIGRLTGDSAQSVANVPIWFVPQYVAPRGPRSDGGKSIPLSMEARTDASGTYRSPPLPAGQWHVLVGNTQSPLARKNDITVGKVEVSLEPIALPRLYAVIVRVKDENGQPIQGAGVTGMGGSGGTITGVTDGRGEFSGERMPAGRWRVFATMADGRRGTAIVEVPIQNGAAIDIALRAALRAVDRR